MDPTIPEICPLAFRESGFQEPGLHAGWVGAGLQAEARGWGGPRRAEGPQLPLWRCSWLGASVPPRLRGRAWLRERLSDFLPLLTVSAVPLRVHFPRYLIEEQLTPIRALSCR